MDTTILMSIGLSELQAKIYLYLIEHGQSVPSKIATDIGENRTTVYSALEKLEKLGIVSQKNKGKISAYVPNHPSVFESITEKRLRNVARQSRNLESNLPSLINYYHEHQSEPGVTTFYGQEGARFIYDKILSTRSTLYFVRSRSDSKADREALTRFKYERARLGINSENISTSDMLNENNDSVKKTFLLDRTLLPFSEYDSPVEIDIFGDNVAFINYDKNGMSTLIESPEIADAMRQFFFFSRKYIKKATDQVALDEGIRARVEGKKSPDG